jgi:hypothetical protein
MKKFYLLILTLISLTSTKAQMLFTVSVSQPTQCYSSGNNTVQATVVNTVSGATNYTWIATSSGTCLGVVTLIGNGQTANISFPCCGIFNLYCSATNNTITPGTPITMGSSVVITTIACVAPISISGSSAVCQGSSLPLLATGSTNYTWQPGNLTTPSVNPIVNANTCFTVRGTAANGCTNSAIHCVSVSPTPTLSFSGNTLVCASAPTTFSVTGANNYTWYIGASAATGSVISVTPAAVTCYSVKGANANGCYVYAGICVNVLSTSLTVSPTSFSVCKGSSVTFSAGGAITYTWSTGAQTNTINVIPTSSTFYNVYGIGANGCVGFRSVSVTVNPNCSDVWPGDANSDGIVNNIDIFELGLAYLNSGPARVPGGNNYNSQFANNWTGTISTGKNKCHADCNGNGVVSLSDTLAIHNNFLLNHPFKPATVTDATADLSISPAIGSFNAGAWNKVDLMLSDNGQSIPLIAGAAFDLNFDPSLIETDSLYLVYTPSFMNAGNQNINFRKNYFLNGVVYAATVRTDGSDVNGSGKIAELHFKMKTGIPLQSVLNLSITNASRVSQNGTLTGITGGASALSQVALGIKNTNAEQSGFVVFPNPASDRVTLASESSGTLSYQIHDIAGRHLMGGKFEGTKTLDLSALANGTYVLQITSRDNSWHNKLIVNK